MGYDVAAVDIPEFHQSDRLRELYSRHGIDYRGVNLRHHKLPYDDASFDAVLNPPPTDYLYFVSRGDGTTKFSATLPEHNRAVSKFQKGGH